MLVTLKTERPPVVKFQHEGAHILSIGTIDFKMSNATTFEQVDLLSVKAFAEAELSDLEIVEDKGTKQLSLRSKIEIKSIRTLAINRQSGGVLATQMLVEILKPLVQEQLNDQISTKGIPLAVSVGKFLKKPNFEFRERTLEIAGDFEM